MKKIQYKVGRKRFDGKNEARVLQKLEEAFMMAASDQEAAIYAGISVSALYEYQKINPAFQERKLALKNLPSLRAKKTIVDRLGKDVELAKWWLAKHNAGEFGDEQGRVRPPVKMIDISAEVKRRAAKYLPRYADGRLVSDDKS